MSTRAVQFILCKECLTRHARSFALQSLVDRNDALRTIYTPNGQGGWIPQALRAGAAKITLNVIDVADSKVRLAHELRRYR